MFGLTFSAPKRIAAGNFLGIARFASIKGVIVPKHFSFKTPFDPGARGQNDAAMGLKRADVCAGRCH